jgi:HSP20 family protein
MAIAVRGTSWDPFTALVRQMDADFDHLVRRAFGTGGSRATGFVPAADVTKDGNDVVITLELPGVNVDSDVDVEVHKGRLVIRGGRREEHSDDDHGVLVREIRSGEFRREFALPEEVTAEQVNAEYEHGLLRVRVHDVNRPAVGPAKIKVHAAGQAKLTASEDSTAESGTEGS